MSTGLFCWLSGFFACAAFVLAVQGHGFAVLLECAMSVLLGVFGYAAHKEAKDGQ